jgi:hypothetical protein
MLFVMDVIHLFGGNYKLALITSALINNCFFFTVKDGAVKHVMILIYAVLVKPA